MEVPCDTTVAEGRFRIALCVSLRILLLSTTSGERLLHK